VLLGASVFPVATVRKLFLLHCAHPYPGSFLLAIKSAQPAVLQLLPFSLLHRSSRIARTTLSCEPYPPSVDHRRLRTSHRAARPASQPGELRRGLRFNTVKFYPGCSILFLRIPQPHRSYLCGFPYRQALLTLFSSDPPQLYFSCGPRQVVPLFLSSHYR
jgi:hypothetical protein